MYVVRHSTMVSRGKRDLNRQKTKEVKLLHVRLPEQTGVDWPNTAIGVTPTRTHSRMPLQQTESQFMIQKINSYMNEEQS